MRYTSTGWSRRNVELFDDVRHVSGGTKHGWYLKEAFPKDIKEHMWSFPVFHLSSRTYLEIWKRTKHVEYERLILCFSLLSGIKYCKVITVIRIDLIQWDLLGKPIKGSCLAWFGLFIRLLFHVFPYMTEPVGLLVWWGLNNKLWAIFGERRVYTTVPRTEYQNETKEESRRLKMQHFKISVS